MTPTLLITGGSRGIGRATALRAAQAGWNVALTYKSDRAAADAVVDDIRAQGQGSIAVACDVAQEADVLAAFDAAEADLGRLDAVVANAGITGLAATLAEMSVDRLRTMFDTNLLGAVLVARETARRLPNHVRDGDASLVLVSSAAARLGAPFEFVDYAATKGALDSLTLGLSKELAPTGIRVNAVRPGLIDTEIHASGGQPDRAERLSKNVPMARSGAAQEVAEAIFWLCDSASSYCTGALLDVAGGR